MPAITAFAVTAIGPVSRAAAKLGAHGRNVLKNVARRMRNRREAGRLAELDAHMLRDIGLTRSDLRDAYSEPLWRDPTDVLARRAAERQCAKPGLTDATLATRTYPSLDRPCRYLV